MTGNRIAVIAGGLSLEREVSLQSGTRIAAALEGSGHDVRVLDVDPQLGDHLTAFEPDLAYLALHGRMGEDGTIQGLLELLGIPFTGPDARASSLAWDKAVTKALWRRAGIPTPDWVSVSSEAIRDLGAARLLPRVIETLQLPLVVKPSQGGGSMGVGYVNGPDQLTDALIGSFRYHGVALVERRVDGTELAISIVDGEVLPAVEIDIASHGPDDHYDFSARYTPGATMLHAPARLPADVLDAAAAAAVAAYEQADARHVTRVDLMVDDDGKPWLLELDTCPGMTETSLLPAAAEARGMTFAALCETIVDAALSTVPASH
ncbi:D-alanine--D-alanine ligase [Euzebya pacifica]|uniref:D-alanine--D-alanine ligase n=1 Tax=Euzebya pacifica TaxID=1608957 RepID=A0A346Y5L6_9ACTN|nr:D-alanine--D-alanine ligase [Euzebya pacifica]AXV09763.1 D-alanine--D-alanine ligase [Euzebya pacifica]